MNPTFASTDALQLVSHTIGAIIGYIGVVIILVGCLRGLYHFAEKFIGRDILLADIRIELGHYLALGLEFLVGKDIIETVVDPTWSELGKLTIIIILRTALTMFLAHEVKEVREELENESAIRKLKQNFVHTKPAENKS